MVLFADLIVLFDLRLFEGAEGNVMFDQGFPQAKFTSQPAKKRKKGKRVKREGEEVSGRFARLWVRLRFI